VPPQWRREVEQEKERAENLETEVKGRISGSDSDSGLTERVETPKLTETETKRKEDAGEDEVGVSDLIGSGRNASKMPNNSIVGQEMEEGENEDERQCDQLIDCSRQSQEDACNDTLVADLFGEVEPAELKVTPVMATDQKASTGNTERSAHFSDSQ